MEYVLNFKFEAGIAAFKGNVVHKAFELLALKKLAIQNNQNTFTEPDNNLEYKIEELSENVAIIEAINFYCKKQPKVVFTDKDRIDCLDWYAMAIDKYPNYLPTNREIQSVEEYFDFDINKDWADYEFEIKNKKINGKLAIKGTTDWLFKVNDSTLEYVDLKTGRRKCWVTDKVKDLEKLQDDFQLLLYHYALKRSYPNKNILMTILYIRDGGPFTVCYNDEDILKLEEKLKTLFNKIKNQKYLNNIKHGSKKFKCGWCPFKTEIYKNNVSYCDFFEKEVKINGIKKVSDLYLKDDFGEYGQGGGKANK